MGSFERSEFAPIGNCAKSGRAVGQRGTAASILLGAAAALGLAFGAGAGELGFPASALGEFAEKQRPSFEAAPSLAPGAPLVLDAVPPASAPPAATSSPAAASSPAGAPAAAAPAEASTPAPAPPAASRQAAHEAPAETLDRTGSALDEYEARCFVKIDGKVLESRGCRILRDGSKSVVFQIAEGALTIDQRQGRVWTARLDARSFGNVYKTGECWGAKGFYVCDRGRK
jgi:hypothetical protein